MTTRLCRPCDIPTDPDWGVDTVKVGFYVDLSQCDLYSPVWSFTGSRNLADAGMEADRFTGWVPIDVDGEAVPVRIELFSARGLCHLQFNAARMVSADPRSLLPPSALQPLVAGIIDHLRDIIWPTFVQVTEDGEALWADDWADRVLFRRLDLARNFRIPEPSVVRAGIECSASKYGKRRSIETSANGGWTVWNRTAQSGSDRLYDKAAEVRNKQSHQADALRSCDGVFRFETELRRDRLTRLGLGRLSDLDEVSAWKALAHRWDSTRWGSPLSSPGEVAQAVRSLPVKQQASLIGYLHLRAAGMANGFTKNQIRTLNKKAQMCGLTPGMPVHLMGTPSKRLDLYSGTLAPVSEQESLAASIPV